MRPETRAALGDALRACDEISKFAETPDVILTDRLSALAIERLLLILGESLARVRQLEPEVLDRITDSHAVIGMRNLIVHGYDAIDPVRIRDAVRDSLPLLEAEIIALLP